MQIYIRSPKISIALHIKIQNAYETIITIKKRFARTFDQIPDVLKKIQRLNNMLHAADLKMTVKKQCSRAAIGETKIFKSNL